MTEDIRPQIVALLPRLRRFACALSGDADRGDDLVQETCVRALSKSEQWQPGTRLDSWLYRILQNLWLDSLRAARVRGVKEDVDMVAQVMGEDGRITTESRLTLEAVSRAMGELPNDQRTLIALVCIEELSYKEAADMLGIPIGTVMSRLARARRALHEAIHAPGQQTPSRQGRSRHERNFG